MTRDNSSQIEFWNDRPGRSWARHSDAVDAMFAGLTEAILDASAPAADDRVLDLGCGAGGLAIPLAGRVPEGGVTAIDVSEPMVAVARQRAAEAGVNIRFIVADAAACPLEPESFDLLVSRLGAMFFGDPVLAFGSLRRALAPRGRIVLGVWREPRENAWAMVPVSAARAFLEIPPRSAPEEPGPFSFADPERVCGILENAGFAAPSCAPLDLDMPVGEDIERAVEFLVEVGPLASPYAAAGEADRRRAWDAVAGTLEKNRRDGSIRLGGGCWIVTAGVG